ncbi:MAG: hypothetical protein P1U85_16795 [Verrucomicrobiales bacterium]|nr:hypothetical protein [Verrucomicrobiales bacterium]
MESSEVSFVSGDRVEYGQTGFYSVDLLLIIVGSLVMLVLPIAFTGSFALAVIKKSKGWGISTVAFGLLSVVAIVALLFLARSVTFVPSGPVTVKEWEVHDIPGGMKVEVLKGWEKSETGEGSLLFASPDRSVTFAVIAESRDHFAEGFPLIAYAEFYAEQIDDQLGKLFQRDLLEPFTADGKDGYQVEFRHLVDPPAGFVRAGFLEGEDRFYRMIGKGSPRDREQIEEILKSVCFEKEGET